MGDIHEESTVTVVEGSEVSWRWNQWFCRCIIWPSLTNKAYQKYFL